MSCQTDTVAPHLCPLCGQPNGCAMQAAKDQGTPVGVCWCVNVSFSPELLARVPQAAQRKACICQACASAGTSSV